jgi:predicted Zn-dependent peptidase
MNRPAARTAALCLAGFLAAAPAALAQNIDAKEYRLDNGMQVLMVEKHEVPTVMCGIFARVGSANETAGITGISHLFEHMMFKGTEKIGTKNIKRDREIMAKLDAIREEMRAEERLMRERYRRGEIADMNAPEAKTERYRELESEFDRLILEQREITLKEPLNEIYAKNGGFFLNAFTTEDMTGYFVRLPKNRIELYMWLESDRFMNPVFREFYSERDVVHEERRLGIDSTPTGRIEEEFQAMFWKSSSYRWNVVGWPSDLENITREQANAYYDTYYAPNNLIMILIGDIEPEETIRMVRRYFDRIPRGDVEPPDVVTLEEPQYAERRMIAEAEASPQVKIWFHTVAFKHPDSYPLAVLAGVLSGKTGRLYRKLVEEEGLAIGAERHGGMYGGGGLYVGAVQDTRKYGGVFMIAAEGKDGVDPARLERAVDEVLDDLRTGPVTEEELQKVKNQLRVDQIRFLDLMSGIGTLFYLGQNAALGDWTEANHHPDKCDLVTADDIRRVLDTYFGRDQRNVLLVRTKAGGTDAGSGEDPRMARFVRMIESMDDPAELGQMIDMFSMRLEKVENPEERTQMEKLLEIARERLSRLEAAGDE